MRTRVLVAVALLCCGCADSRRDVGDRGREQNRTEPALTAGPDDVVFQVTEQSGMTTLANVLAQLPALTVYGSGRFILAEPDLGQPRIFDAGTLVVDWYDGTGARTTVSAYATGIESGDQAGEADLPREQLDRRTALVELVRSTLGAVEDPQPWRPSRYLAFDAETADCRVVAAGAVPDAQSDEVLRPQLPGETGCPPVSR